MDFEGVVGNDIVVDLNNVLPNGAASVKDVENLDIDPGKDNVRTIVVRINALKRPIKVSAHDVPVAETLEALKVKIATNVYYNPDIVGFPATVADEGIEKNIDINVRVNVPNSNVLVFASSKDVLVGDSSVEIKIISIKGGVQKMDM